MNRATSAVRSSVSRVASAGSSSVQPAETVTLSSCPSSERTTWGSEQGSHFVGDLHRPLAVRSVEHDDEFLAAQASHEVAGAEARREDVGEGLEHQVPDLVAMRLVASMRSSASSK